MSEFIDSIDRNRSFMQRTTLGQVGIVCLLSVRMQQYSPLTPLRRSTTLHMSSKQIAFANKGGQVRVGMAAMEDGISSKDTATNRNY